MEHFKQLQWNSHTEFDGFYAAPHGLRWRYSIIVHDNDRVEFALLDHYFEYAEGFPQNFSSVTEAKTYAAEHYNQLLKQIAL